MRFSFAFMCFYWFVSDYLKYCYCASFAALNVEVAISHDNYRDTHDYYENVSHCLSPLRLKSFSFHGFSIPQLDYNASFYLNLMKTHHIVGFLLQPLYIDS